MIELQNIRKTFRVQGANPFGGARTVEALRGISLAAGRGEAVALAGRNGAGKTTLLKVLGSLIQPDDGEVKICGIDVARNSSAALRKTGNVSGEERSFYWRLTGRQNLEFFGALQDVPRKELKGRISEMLDLLGLSDAADAPVRSYSSGMRQRLSLARGLLHRPEVLLMDEPNRSADPAMQAWFIDYVKNEIVDKRQCTVLFATHNLEEALELGGRVAVIEKGEIRFNGKPENAADIRSMLQEFERKQ